MAIRILLAGGDPSFVEAVQRGMEKRDDMTLVGVVSDLGSVLPAAMGGRPDLLLFHLGLGPQPWLVLQQVREQVPEPPRILAVAPEGREELVVRAIARGVDYCILEPFDVPTLLQRAYQLVREPAPSVWTGGSRPQSPQLEAQIAEILDSLGVPRRFKGYGYLVEAIGAVVREPELIGSVTRRLYPMVARSRGATPRQVERAIRTCIEAAWTRGDLEALQAFFAYQIDSSRGKPTNSSFIARVATEVRLRRHRFHRQAKKSSGSSPTDTPQNHSHPR